MRRHTHTHNNQIKYPPVFKKYCLVCGKIQCIHLHFTLSHIFELANQAVYLMNDKQNWIAIAIFAFFLFIFLHLCFGCCVADFVAIEILFNFPFKLIVCIVCSWIVRGGSEWKTSNSCSIWCITIAMTNHVPIQMNCNVLLYLICLYSIVQMMHDLCAI